jgi:hypothetical protein
MIYRRSLSQKKDGLKALEIRLKESNIFISSNAQKPIKAKARRYIRQLRKDIKQYISCEPEFENSFSPLKPKEDAPEIIKEMCLAASKAKVGPMAAVAGALAMELGKLLKQDCSEIIVENGGDIYVRLKRPIIVGLWCKNDEIRKSLALKLPKVRGHISVCTSSGIFGHSYSAGKADAATIIARNTALADAWATRLGNEIKSKKDIERGLSLIKNQKDILGALIIMGKSIALYGNVELTQIPR